MELVDLEAKDYMSVKLRLVMELVENHVHTMGIPGECEHEASNILSADTNTTNRKLVSFRESTNDPG